MLAGTAKRETTKRAGQPGRSKQVRYVNGWEGLLRRNAADETSL